METKNISKTRYLLAALFKVVLIFFISASGLSINYAGNDADGVPDLSDLDDDNDGILDSLEGVCPPPRVQPPLNTSGYTLNAQLQNTPGFPLTFYGGEMTFTALLTGVTNWTPGSGGTRVQNVGLADNAIYVQPRNSGNYETTGNDAFYTFDFPGGVQALSFRLGGLNFADGITISASFQGVPISLGASNYSNFINSSGGTAASIPSGGSSVNFRLETVNSLDDTVVSDDTGGGGAIVSNGYTVSIAGPVDQVIVNAGKFNSNRTGNVTLGFNSIIFQPYCPVVDTDLDTIPDYLDTDSDGDMCPDADEAYAAVDTDTNGDGTFGGVVGPGQVNGVGQVIGATYPTPASTGSETTFQEGILMSITAQPTDQTFVVGSTATFSANVSSTAVVNDPTVTTSTNFTYQWQVSTDGGSNFNNVVGGTGGSGTASSGSTLSYTTPTLALGNVGDIYRLVVTNNANICGATSVTATFDAIVANVSIVKTDGQANYTPGEPFNYTITAANAGPDAADGSVVADSIPAWAVNPTWACAATGGAVCPNASGSGNINETIATFPDGGQLVYTVSGTYSTDMANY